MKEHIRQTCVFESCGVNASAYVSNMLTYGPGAWPRFQKRNEAHRELDLGRVVEAMKNIFGRDNVQVAIETA